MTIRAKIAIILITLIALYAGPVYGVHRLLIFPKFVALERAEARKDMERCMEGLRREIHYLDALCHDWAAWNDTYEFVLYRNKDYVESNLVMTTFEDNKLNLFYIFNLEGGVVWGELCDLETGEPLQIDEFSSGGLPKTHTLLGHKTSESSLAGIHMTEHGPMLVASRPIVTSDGAGPSRGTLVMGRFLDENFVEMLARQTQVDIQISYVQDEALPLEEKKPAPKAMDDDSFILNEISDDLLQVGATFPDIQGSPALLLQADISRDIFARGTLATRYAMLSSLGTGVGVLLVLVVFLNRIVAAPLGRLTRHVMAIGECDDSPSRLSMKRKDEIGTLAREFDRMVEKIWSAKQENARLAAIVTSSDDAIIGMTLDGIINTWNRGAEALYGYSPEDIHGHSISRLFKPGQDDEAQRIIEKIMRGKTVRYESAVHIGREDRRVDVSLIASAIRNGDNRPIGISMVAHDITERKKAEEALKESEQQYRTLVDGSLTGFCLLQDGVYRFVNERFSQMSGYSREELLGMSFKQLIHPNDAELAERIVLGRLAGDYNSEHQQVRAIKKNGDIVWIESLGTVVDYQGKPAVLINFVDITERKMAEQKRRESEERYRILFEESRDVVFITSLSGDFRDINPAGVELLGYSSKDELLKINVGRDIYVNSTDREAFQEKMASEGFVKDYEMLLKTKDGRPLNTLVTANTVYSDTGNIVAYRGILRDVTEHKRLQKQFLQAQKMESVGTLAGGIAHDFNNILGAILGYACLIKNKMPEQNQIYEYASTIERSATRAAKLTSQLLAFARGGKYEVKPINLNNIVIETLEMIGRTFDKSIEIERELHFDLSTVEADAGQIQQVLMNLCVNAKDAMDGGGKLIVQTAMENLTDAYTRTHFKAKSGSYVTLSVTDTGVGIDKETIQRIFEPFYTTKAEGKGTGLGLAMVYGVVKNHGGFVNVYSELCVGTTFKIYLPKSGKPEAEELSETEQPSGGCELVLVVDDEEPIRFLTKEILESSGYRVLLAENGSKAVEVFMKYGDEIDLVILDMVMPKMGGRETFLELRALDPAVKALLSSGYSQDTKTKQIINSGVRGFIQKPYQVDTLLSKVRHVLDSSD